MWNTLLTTPVPDASSYIDVSIFLPSFGICSSSLPTHNVAPALARRRRPPDMQGMYDPVSCRSAHRMSRLSGSKVSLALLTHLSGHSHPCIDSSFLLPDKHGRRCASWPKKGILTRLSRTSKTNASRSSTPSPLRESDKPVRQLLSLLYIQVDGS